MTLASSGQLASEQLLNPKSGSNDLPATGAAAAPSFSLEESLLLTPTRGDTDLLFNASDIDAVLAYSSPRQRIELLSWPPAPAGYSFQYSWSTYLQSPISTSNSLFHLWQLFSRAEGGPTVTLTATKGRVAIDDNVREGCGATCPQIQIGQYTDMVVRHDVRVTFGDNGSLRYIMTNAASGTTMMRYAAKGYMGADSSLKVRHDAGSA